MMKITKMVKRILQNVHKIGNSKQLIIKSVILFFAWDEQTEDSSVIAKFEQTLPSVD